MTKQRKNFKLSSISRTIKLHLNGEMYLHRFQQLQAGSIDDILLFLKKMGLVEIRPAGFYKSSAGLRRKKTTLKPRYFLIPTYLPFYDQILQDQKKAIEKKESFDVMSYSFGDYRISIKKFIFAIGYLLNDDKKMNTFLRLGKIRGAKLSTKEMKGFLDFLYDFGFFVHEGGASLRWTEGSLENLRITYDFYKNRV